MLDDPIRLAMLAGAPITTTRKLTHRKPRGMHRREILRALIDEHGDACSICREPLGNIADCNVDHVLPISRGGTSAWSNLRPAHTRCNSIKGDRVNFSLCPPSSA